MYLDSLDIANRACQILGAEQIASVTEDSVQNVEMSFAYDKLRRSELQTNVWTFATRKSVLRAINPGDMLIVPPLWSATVNYLPGAIVTDSNNQFWISTWEQNINNPPGGNNDTWDPYFGPLTVTPWDSQTSYYTGELVYIPGTGAGTGPTFNGGYQIFMSLTNGNEDVPNTGTEWSGTTVYYGGQQVSYSGVNYVSIIEYNIGNTPQAAASVWVITNPYVAGAIVAGSDNFLYQAANNNTGYNPVGDTSGHWTPLNAPNAWTVSPVAAADISWRPISTVMHNLLIPYPIGSGPSYQTYTRNAYRLPAGFLKVAPQQPKMGSVSILGAPTGANYLDWAYEGDYLLSYDNGPIVLRFVADVTRVDKFHDLFSEGVACRVAFETCQKVTQSNTKQQMANGLYARAITSAKTQNAIETGADEAPVDDYIATRI